MRRVPAVVVLVDFAVGYGKWFVDCCYLRIALQNLDPPFPEQERIGDFESDGMIWTVYDIGPRDGTMIVAKATGGAITVLVSAQVRFPDEAFEGTAQRVVERVARSVVVTDSDGRARDARRKPGQHASFVTTR